MQLASTRGAGPTGERSFFTAMSFVLLAAVVLGFSRTFFFTPWFPEARELVPPERFFVLHGTAAATWFVLLIAQAALVASGNLRRHRQLGRYGAALAAVIVVLGIYGGLLAAGRPGGFIGVPVPPLLFLVVPVAAMTAFAVFVALAIARRADPQSHKRYMLLASIAMIEAAVARWPFGFMAQPSPVPGLSTFALVTCLFLVPLVAWDLASRGRLHPVTLWGGLALIATLLLRLPLASTEAWQGFARWAVGLVG
jgi:uncharacterized membrane protein YozB (DUF420 family)